MSHPIRSVCVYCGSREGTDPHFSEGAKALGSLIGGAGIDLVYGAGSIGLMGIIARAAIAAGSRVIGIIPEHLDAVEITQPGLSETHITHNMHERKKLMFDRSDAFVILPGGLGTLDETFEIMTWAQLSLHQKPIILVNQNGYWNPFITLLHHIVSNGFASNAHAELLTIVESPQDAFQILTRKSVTSEAVRSDLF